MDLQCKQKHMAGQSITINGTTYEIDADGVAKGLSDADAKKLRMFDHWEPVAGSKKASAPAKPKEAAKPKEEPKAKEPEPTPDPEPEEPEQEEEEEYEDEPSEDMDIEELRAMADAYEVSYTSRTGAATLVKRIKEAMYED